MFQAGVCNQYNECHCNKGLNPGDDCKSPGPGGSMRSGPQAIYITTTTSTTDSTNTIDTTTKSIYTDPWVTRKSIEKNKFKLFTFLYYCHYLILLF